MTTTTTKSAVPRKYDSDSIETLQFPLNVRANASQYIGGVDEQGLFNVWRELGDNAVDEALAGRNTGVLFYFDKDGSYWVQDKGHGIPQGMKTQIINVSGKPVKSQMPTMQAVFGALHTSGKYRDDAYKVSIGSHGIGAKGTNATAEFFEVWTKYENQWYNIAFKKGHLITGVRKCNRPKAPVGTITEGTLIHYKPDSTIFSAKRFPVSMAVEWAQIMAYMNPGFKIILAAHTGKTKSFYSKLGAKDYITERLTVMKCDAEPSVFEHHSSLADVVIAFSSYDGSDLRGFTNGLFNIQGGYHVDAVSKALYRAIEPYKNKKHTFTRREFDDGLLGIVNAKLHKASFSSQDKAKLTDTRMGAEFEETLFADATAFFKGNKALALRLCDKANKIAELRTKFKASKAVVSAINGMRRGGLPSNYAPAGRDVKIKDRELFIVEGESAAGGFRKVRARHQALLPMRGKVLNLLKKGQQALVSKAIIAILVAVGYDAKAEDPIGKFQFGRIVLLADADADGGHINSLLLTLFYKLMPEVFDRGLVYVADMPEFMAQPKGLLVTGNSNSEVQAKLKTLGLKAPVKHFKGWGEVDPPVLKILAVNDSRKLIKIQPISKESGVRFEAIMAKDVEARREALGITEEKHHAE